jgi:hypothetical protein
MRRDYYHVVIVIAKELLTAIPLDSLLNKYLGNMKKGSSTDLLSVNHAYFSKKLDCLLNILALTSYCSNNNNQGKEGNSSVSSTDVTSCLSSYDLNQLTFDKKVHKVPLDKNSFFDQMKEGFSLSSTSPSKSSSTKSTSPLSPSPATSSFSLSSDNIRTVSDLSSSRPATIIFCNMKLTVLVLHHLIHELSLNWKATGASDEFSLHSGCISGDMNVTDQRHILKDLKDGNINLLFATDVAQEGIDISQCNVIINYDGPKTLIGFIQRRGRARSLSSLLIHLVSSLNEADDIEMKDIFNFLKQEDETNEVLRVFLNEWQDDSKENKSELLKEFRFVVPETGASVDYIKAKTLLQEFCDYFNQQEEKKKRKLRGVGDVVENEDSSSVVVASDIIDCEFEVTYPMYFFESSGTCTLIMPSAFRRKYPDCQSFIVNATTKKMAKKGLVALEAIKYLHSKGELDNHLRFRQPTISSTSDKFFDGASSPFYASSSSTTVNMVKIEMKRCSDIITSKPVKEVEDGSMSLYFYGFEVNVNYDENALKMKLWSQLQALKRICYVFHFPLPEVLFASASSSFYFFLKFSKDQLKELRTTNGTGKEAAEEMEQLLKSSLKLVFLGKKQVTKKELSLIQMFHKSIYSLHPFSFDSSASSPVADGTLLDAATVERCFPDFLTKSSDVEVPVFYDFEEWKSSVDSSHFFVLPLPQSVVCVSSSSSVLSLITVDYLKDCVKDSFLLLSNLSAIRYNNHHNLDGYFFEKDVSSVDSSLLYTNNGKHLLCFERNSSRNNKKFTDSMHDEKQEEEEEEGGEKQNGDIQSSKKKLQKTFYEHYQKKAISRNDPNLQAFVEELASRNNPQYFLTTGYPVSAKMEGYSLFGKKYDTSNTAKKTEFSVGTEVDLIPELCHPIGSLLFFEMSLLLPSLTHRMQSLLLANELQEKLVSVLETDHKINVYDILGGIVPKRSLETMNSERYIACRWLYVFSSRCSYAFFRLFCFIDWNFLVIVS